MIIQLIGLTENGLGAVVNLVHCLGDAQTLLCFIHHWAEGHCQGGDCAAISALPLQFLVLR